MSNSVEFGDTILNSLLCLLLFASLPASGAQPATSPGAQPQAARPSAPKIAVVLDDFGLTYKPNVKDEAWMAVKWPVTFAVMPESPRTKEAAKATKAAGHELIIHFPFDPFLSLDLPKDRVSDADLAKVRKLLDKSFRDIPGAVGLNNHRSLKATKNRPLMKAFMADLRSKGVYFLDSHVSPKSVAGDEARAAGLRVAVNQMFLESPPHYNNKPFCQKILRRVAAMARKRGSAVVIGHHYFPGTYECLTEEVPKLQAEGFEFVFASDLAK
ncbi:MAG: divergent polysaccharide deacetylase family protein [Elusimicrobia bacterium]|nr:divergent polysaccharide deacetylase family protein [Elusimicrobiota bacterium]